MKFTKPNVSNLTLPADKNDLIVWDDDMPGFGIRLRRNSRVFVIQGRTNGQQWRETIGDVRKFTIDAARTIARKRFAEITLGGDPRATKAEAKARAALTLGTQANRYLEAKKGSLRTASYTANKRYLTDHFASLHGLPLHAIKRRDVAAALNRLAAEHGKVSAARARSALSAFFTWAMREGIADENPVAGTNRPDEGVDSRDHVLSDDELRTVWNACDDYDFGRIVRLLMLTACRRDEVGDLQWSEVDFDKAMVHIPGSRTKNREPLNLPLSPPALAILEAAPRKGDREFVFGGRGEGFTAWSYSALSLSARITEAQGKPLAPWTLHDIRRTVATGMGKIGVLPHIIEAVLNHVGGHKGGVAGVYNRATYEREMRDALLRWSAHLKSIIDGSDRKVVALRAANEVAG
jgi:integrase